MCVVCINIGVDYSREFIEIQDDSICTSSSVADGDLWIVTSCVSD